MGKVICLLVALLSALPAFAADLIGQITVVDGDTLEMHGQRIRVWGIDAPESDQLCRGSDSIPYKCGAKAANELSAFIGSRIVTCVSITVDRYRRVVAACTVDNVDLAEWLVRSGLALDWPQYSRGKYASMQGEAERAERGLWAGSYVNPWQYRMCIRAGGRPGSCSD